MTTARYRPTWDLALDPLVSCKLCLGEYPVEQMTTIAQCQCIFCTLVGSLEEACVRLSPGCPLGRHPAQPGTPLGWVLESLTCGREAPVRPL